MKKDDIVRVITYRKKDNVIDDIFEFSISEWETKSSQFGAAMNRRIMEAYKKIASGEASKVEIQKGEW